LRNETVTAPDGTTFARPRFEDVDTNADRSLSRSEFVRWSTENEAVLRYYAKASPEVLFDVMDENGDGAVSYDETGCAALQ